MTIVTCSVCESYWSPKDIKVMGHSKGSKILKLCGKNWISEDSKRCENFKPTNFIFCESRHARLHVDICLNDNIHIHLSSCKKCDLGEQVVEINRGVPPTSHSKLVIRKGKSKLIQRSI